MYAIVFFFALFFAAGAYLVLADLLKLPTLATTRAVLTIGKMDKKQAMNLEAITFELSTRLSRIVRLDSYKRRKLEAALKSAGI